MGIRNLLEDEIESQFEGLSGLELGTEEYKTTVDGLTKLVDLAIVIDKQDTELNQRQIDRENEIIIAEEKAEVERKNQLVQNGLTIAGIVIPVAVTIWGTITTLRFEETGSVTTTMGRGFIQKLLPKK